MPLECDYFAGQTVQSTQQSADCISQSYELSDTGLDEIPFYLIVLDTLERLNIGPTLEQIAAQTAGATPCDAVQALRNATCIMQPISSPGTEDPHKLQSLIALKLNNAGC